MINAFCNSYINKELYYYPPNGFKMPGWILLLQKALYGLKQSPLLWHSALNTTLNRLKLMQILGVSCLFANQYLIIFFFVDDIVVLVIEKHRKHLEKFEEVLQSIYDLKVIGPLSWFLEIRIIRDESTRKIWLIQDSYIEKIASKFHCNNEKPPKTLLATEDLQPSASQATPEQIHAYQQRVGSINFAIVVIRPDITRAASKLA